MAESAGALRAAAALYRAAVEDLRADLNAQGSNLHDRIEWLKTGSRLDEDLVDNPHEARLLGNWSLHQGLVFDTAEVGDVAELIDEAVYVQYVQPKRVERARMRERRRARRDQGANGGDSPIDPSGV